MQTQSCRRGMKKEASVCVCRPLSARLSRLIYQPWPLTSGRGHAQFTGSGMCCITLPAAVAAVCVCVCLDSCGCLLNHTQTLVTRRGEILIIPPPRLCCFHLSVSCRFYWSCLPFTVNLFPVTTAMESFAAPAACEECSEKPHVWCFSM